MQIIIRTHTPPHGKGKMHAVLVINGIQIPLEEQRDETVLCSHTDWVACPHKRQLSAQQKKELQNKIKTKKWNDTLCPYCLIRDFSAQVDEKYLNQRCQFKIFIEEPKSNTQCYVYLIESLKASQELEVEEFIPSFSPKPELEDKFAQCMYKQVAQGNG